MKRGGVRGGDERRGERMDEREGCERRVRREYSQVF